MKKPGQNLISNLTKKYFSWILLQFPRSCQKGYGKVKVNSERHHLVASIPKEKPMWTLEKQNILAIAKWKMIKIYFQNIFLSFLPHFPKSCQKDYGKVKKNLKDTT